MAEERAAGEIGREAWAATLAWLLPAGVERVLLATLGFGDGHNRAARALAQLCGRVRPEVETRVIDALDGPAAPGWRRRRSVYYAALRACPGVYHRAYRLLGRWRWPLHRLTGSLVPWLDREVGAWGAEWVVATHVFSAGAAERVARRRPLGTAGLVTDLVDDAYWNRTRLDRYLVGTPELAARLALAGIPSPSVRVSGLPVDPVFFAPLDRSEARRRLGLDPTAFTVLLLGGGAGFGPLRAAAAALGRGELPLQVVAVAGRNEELQSRLETLRLTARVPLHVVGFTGRIHEYVAAADVVVTKPGGMTVAECLSRRRPMVLLGAPLPGPEAENHRWLVGRGLASPARDASELVELLRVRLPDRGDELRRMR